jgi:uncharacterized repeat protein (TIGR01451 family)
MGRRALALSLSGLVLVLMLPALASATVLWNADLGVSLDASPGTQVGGSDVSFTATVTNDGENDAYHAVVTDTLPPGAVFVPDGSDESCTQVAAADPVVCELGTLSEDDTVDVVIEATMPCASDTLVDSVDVEADNPDPHHSNNSDSVSVTVETPCSGTSQEVEDGGTVTTDPDHVGTDPDLGVFETATMVVPEGISGDVSIQLTIGDVLHECPGFTALVATTDQPAATGEDRLALIFTYAACSIPEGTNIEDTTIFKSVDGHTFVSLPTCQTYVLPDPCLKRARVLRSGDFRYRVLWSGQGDPSWRPG